MNSEPHSEMLTEFKLLTWAQVKPIWDTELWPGRDSEPVTSMKFLGGYDMDYKNRTPIFIGLMAREAIIGVNSIVRTEGCEWRSRGLWVSPFFRGNGHGVQLLQESAAKARVEGGLKIWSLPKREAFRSYEKAGFKQASEWSEHDWGTNCYVIRSL